MDSNENERDKQSGDVGEQAIDPLAVTGQMLEAVARGLDRFFNGSLKQGEKATGFVLLTFPYGQQGKTNYISNGANREDIKILFREIIDVWEKE